MHLNKEDELQQQQKSPEWNLWVWFMRFATVPFQQENGERERETVYMQNVQ